MSELKKQKQERYQRNDLKEKQDDKEKKPMDIKININTIEKKESPKVDPVVPTSRPSDDYELEEGFIWNWKSSPGEDDAATMQQLMGFSAFSSTKVRLNMKTDP